MTRAAERLAMQEGVPFDHAETYRAKGWQGPIALPRRKKEPPPSEFTGAGGRWPTPRDWEAWRGKGLENIALRLPPVVVGLDVDDYGNKPGASELRRLESMWGELPLTWLSTSREGGASGIRLYRIPVDDRAWPTEAAPAIEIIRFAHRYVVCWPSIHPEGRVYRWRKPDGTWADDGEVPGLSDLPELPASWLAGLTGVPIPDGRGVSPARANKREQRREAREWLRQVPGGEPCRYVGRLAADARAAAQREEGAAYDHTRDAVMALLRAAETGHPGVGAILSDVRSTYIETVSDRTHKTVAEAEFDRFTLDGVGRILKEPSERSGQGCDCAGGVTVTLGGGWGASKAALATTNSEWPEPPGEAAFYGLAGEIVRAVAPHTEADAVALLVNALAAMGSAVGRGPHFAVGGTRHYSRDFFALVGRTSKARKGDSWNPVQLLFGGADESWSLRVTNGMSTGEGLIHAVRDPVEKVEPIKEKGQITGHQTVLVDEGVADKRLMVVESELARCLSVIGRQGNTLSAVVRDGWDDRTLNVMTKSPARATGSHISIVGHVTIDELKRELEEVQAANGFANRFIWITVRRSKSLPDPEPFDGREVEQLSLRVRRAIHSARSVQRMERDADAAALWREVYDELSQERDGMAGAILARAEAHVLRLSMLYALFDGSPLIRLEHLAAALELWAFSERSVTYVFGEATGDPVADAIDRAARASGKLTRTAISALFGRNQSAARIDLALQQLAQSGRGTLERSVGEGGRMIDVWVAS